jgi:hypothetical protein
MGHPLTDEVKAALASFAIALRNHPDVCANITVFPSKSKPSSGKDRLNAVINYFVDKEGIDKNRFKPIIGKYTDQKKNIVEIRAHREE